MKNILVLKNYDITDHTQWPSDRTHETGLKEGYNDMEKMCVSSARKYLDDLDDIIVSRGKAENIRDVFVSHFHDIYDIWKQGNNVLYTDLDVLFVKPVKVFGEFDFFGMFNLTSPPVTRCTKRNVNLGAYFNCGIRYYPANMSQAIWDKGFQMLEDWDSGRWDAEQIMYNIMMWDQGVSFDQVFRQELSYQLLKHSDHAFNEKFNHTCPLKEAKIIHFHGSRDATVRAALMKKLYDQSTNA